GDKPVKLRIDISFEGEHVRGRKLLARSENAINPIGAPRRFPLRADRIWITVGRNAPIRGANNPRAGIHYAGQLFEWDVARPLMRVVTPVSGQAAITGGANRNFSCGLVSDIAIHICINDVLAGSFE